MKRYFLYFCLLSSFAAHSQGVEALSKKYASGDFNAVLIEGIELEKKEPSNIDLKLLLGRCYADAGLPDKAIPYLLSVSTDNTSWRKAWATAYLGGIYFQKGAYRQAKEYLQEAARLNATETVNRYMKKRYALFGFSDPYEGFQTKESGHIIFHFDPRALALIGSIDDFMREREQGFEKINRFFNSTLPKKVDFFVWATREALTAATGSAGGFSAPEYGICHTVVNQTPGHELTHVISHYSAPIVHKSVLINEGTAVFFDQTGRNRLEAARQRVLATGTPVKLAELWESRAANEDLLYSVAGAFTEYLIAMGGKEKFLELFQNQGYEQAHKLYGERFAEWVTGFERLVNGEPQLATAATPATQMKWTRSEIEAVMETKDPSSKYYRVLILINGKPSTIKQMEGTDPMKIREIKVISRKEELKDFTTEDVDLNGIIMISSL